MRAKQSESLARAVVSNQTGIHPDLKKFVNRYQMTEWQTAIPSHTQQAFAQTVEWLAKFPAHTPLILDSGCGVGQSTALLAIAYPEHLVVGVDRSADRLSRQPDLPDNATILRADLTGFWRLAAQANWQLAKHTVFYPNPYPKAKHVQRRWHAHPVFPSVIQLGGQFECRSNWLLYLEELAAALELYGIQATLHQLPATSEPISFFEKKYRDAQQTCWQLTADLFAARDLTVA